MAEALAAPTTTRYLAFLAALLSAGIFVGTWVYNETQGRHWVDVVISCAGQAQQATVSLQPVQAELAREALEARCRGAADLRCAASGLGGAAAVGVGALAVVYLAPVTVRRRRRLREPGLPLREAGARFAELAAEAGIRRVPLLERGPASQRDAFSYGPPGRPRVVLPPAVAVRWRDRELFDPLVRHELAHVRHRDVALAWLARSAWYALAPLLILPVLVSLLSGDHSILADLLWRAALLGLTVLLVSAALLRCREHDADLRAAQITGARHWPRCCAGRPADPNGTAFGGSSPAIPLRTSGSGCCTSRNVPLTSRSWTASAPPSWPGCCSPRSLPSCS